MSVHDDPDELYRSEFDAREFQREIEEAEEQLDRNTRSLADVFIEYMERGDLVEVSVGARHWQGTVVAVSDELVTIETEAHLVDVSLGHLDRAAVVAPQHGPGKAYKPAPVASIIARLRELNAAGADALADIGGHEVDEARCRVVAVSTSHAELSTRDEALVLLPLRAIGYVARDK